MFNVKKTWISSLAVLLVVFAVLLFGAVFLYAKIRHVSAEIRNAREQIYIAEKKQQEFANARRSLLEYQKEIATLDFVFIGEDTFVQLIRSFEGTARAAGVSFKAQNAQLPLTDSEEASFSFEIKGDFSSVAKFFALLDQSPYAGMVDRTVIQRVDPKSKTIQANITYLIFNYLR